MSSLLCVLLFAHLSTVTRPADSMRSRQPTRTKTATEDCAPVAVRLPLLVSQCPHRRCRDPQADRRTGAGSRADDAAAHTRPCKERRDRVTAERRINEQRIAE